MRSCAHSKLVKESTQLRRAGLLKTMQDLKDKSVGCSSCPGKCCTFVANSMQVTPVEAMDLYHFLQEKGLLNEELWQSLTINIEKFRLLSNPHVGAGRSFRRNYTCPFFAGKELGCTIKPEAKPYGCLAFNPSAELESSGESCGSDRSLLVERELSMGQDNHTVESEAGEIYSEEKINSMIREQLGIHWAKESIPVALIDLRKALEGQPSK